MKAAKHDSLEPVASTPFASSAFVGSSLMVGSALVLSAAFGCSTDGNGSAEATTTTSGSAAFEDAETDSSGQPREPASPPPQPSSDPMRVEIRASGIASTEGLAPECSLDGLSGSVDGLYSGEGTIDDDGLYLASFASGSAVFETSGGCELPSPSIESFTEIVIRAELSATTRNCETYCEASARSHAESECSAEADQASCRSEAEAAYAASCETECVSTEHRIVAEAELSATAIAELNARELSGAALGDLAVDLSFDHIEDGEGDTVVEMP